MLLQKHFPDQDIPDDLFQPYMNQVPDHFVIQVQIYD